jgi:hypothetical protein
MLISNYERIRINSKKTVNGRRLNKETRRHKLALASFVPAPRLRKRYAAFANAVLTK